MRINVVGRQFEITDPIRIHAETKAAKLETYSAILQQIDILIWKENDSIEDYTVEISVDVERHEEFVAKANGPDLYSTIDDVVAKVDRQLHDHREKLKAVR